MPIEIIKYLCQFKCGTNAKSTLRQIKLHEIVCFKNPERKACTTCKHEIYEHDGCDHPELAGAPSEEWMNRSCKKISYEEFEKLWTTCDYHSEPKFHIQPVTNCPYHELK
jgi:hypothetical protein